MVSVKFNQEREGRSVHKYILSIETSLFEGLESKFLQEKYYKDKFGYTYGGLYKCSKD